MKLSFFTSDGDALVPTELACSLWSEDQMHGVALSGALARALERAVSDLGRTELRPARYTVDLFRAARMEPVGPAPSWSGRGAGWSWST